jgi:glycosyltransferase involved in cell wall biosynthesis
MKKIFFYPHPNLRDRQLDTVRMWPRADVINAEMAEQKPWHYSAQSTLRQYIPKNWQQYIPAINIKLRPKTAPRNAIVYCWGGIISHGDFIIELDNPYCLTGYSVFALRFYRPILRALLLSRRCRQIRCISQACRETLRLELGDDVAAKAEVFYPVISDIVPGHVPNPVSTIPKLLFISTSFDIKSGALVLRVMKKLQQNNIACHLTMITHMPDEHLSFADELSNVTSIPANLPRAALIEQYASHDIFLHPTLVESFGMVAWEALAHGVALLAYDVYAIEEMISDGVNGRILNPPVANWLPNKMPSPYYSDSQKIKDALTHIDVSLNENQLYHALVEMLQSPETLLKYKLASQQKFKKLSDQNHYFMLPS